MTLFLGWPESALGFLQQSWRGVLLRWKSWSLLKLLAIPVPDKVEDDDEVQKLPDLLVLLNLFRNHLSIFSHFIHHGCGSAGAYLGHSMGERKGFSILHLSKSKLY